MKKGILTFSRITRIFGKILGGKPLLHIHQNKEEWETQFSKGDWNFMLDVERRPALVFVADKIKTEAQRRAISVLDVGCGNGGLAKLLRDTPSIAFTGLDISETAVEVARKVYPQGTFYVVSAETPPAFTKPFDIIVFNDVLYYFEALPTFMRYQQELAPEGKVLVVMYDSWRTDLVWRSLSRVFKAEESFHIMDCLRRKGWKIKWGNYVSC